MHPDDTIKKLTNTNENTDRIFLSVYCDDLYRQNFLALYPLVNTDEKIPLVYTKGIVVGK
jgi:hypothetical protein